VAANFSVPRLLSTGVERTPGCLHHASSPPYAAWFYLPAGLGSYAVAATPYLLYVRHCITAPRWFVNSACACNYAHYLRWFCAATAFSLLDLPDQQWNGSAASASTSRWCPAVALPSLPLTPFAVASPCS